MFKSISKLFHNDVKYSTYYVIVECLQVRNAPSEYSAVVGKFFYGQTVNAHIDGEWAELENGTYVSAKYLSEFPVCEFNGGNQECDLIKELRKKQDELRCVREELRKLNERDPALVSNVVNFLKLCDSYRLFDYIEQYHRHYKDEIRFDNTISLSGIYNMIAILEDVLGGISIEDIDNMFEEFKMLKEKGAIISQKEKSKNILMKDIGEIKSKLGIE